MFIERKSNPSRSKDCYCNSSRCRELTLAFKELARGSERCVAGNWCYYVRLQFKNAMTYYIIFMNDLLASNDLYLVISYKLSFFEPAPLCNPWDSSIATSTYLRTCP